MVTRCDCHAEACLPAFQDQAYLMLRSRAYLHQYERYGMAEAEFDACFAHVEDIIARYGALA